MLTDKPTELSRIKLYINLNSTARPYDQRAFSPLDPTVSWLSHLALAIYIFVVNFDALAQASDIQIERRQVVFLCWMQDLDPGSQTPHDDVIKWTPFPRHWPFVQGIHWSPVSSPHKGQCRGGLMFSLICAWRNDWVNNREAGDLRRHRAHYDVVVMYRYMKQDRHLSS